MDIPNEIFVPHEMSRLELYRNIEAVICRPGMYGVDEFIICLLQNAKDAIYEELFGL